jgi:ubiquitin-activating enzyme E1
MIHSIKFIFFFQGPYTFTIGDTRNFGIYEGGGMVTEVKKPEIVTFVSR